MDPGPDQLWCPNCRSLLRVEDKYCWKCGAGRVQQFPASRPTTWAGTDGRGPLALVLILAGVVFTLLASVAACETGSPAGLVVMGVAAVGCCLAAGRVLASRS